MEAIKAYIKGILTEDGKIIVDLPEGWQAGEIEIGIMVEQATFTDEELAELMKSDPKPANEIETGAEIAQADEIGSWAGIEDSVAFVEEMRRRRREKAQW